ncbi:MAG: putative response regulator in two-component reguatory system, sigma54 dependent transcriptional [Phycisphaerales bacterium]|jgi:DNA-binding NtrC family response regulator|nr:putative response regulator in two-component reguatory system, sigma54 dependent transcriptional [Phycisphaerales bacterium]
MENRPPSEMLAGNDVLVVEDEVRVRTMLASALKEMGFTATFAPTAEAAAKALAQRSFDILILDLNLPGKGGIEFLEHVRRQGCDSQAIILTGFGDLDAARKAIHLEVVDFLTKPCTLGALEVALSRARNRRRGRIGEGHGPTLHFDLAPPNVPPASNGKGSMEEVEQRHILDVLEKHDGNRAAAAVELGISVRKLYYRLGEYQKKGLLP